jgi:hypothetical protein
MEGLRVAAPSYRAAQDGAFTALDQRVSWRSRFDNVAWRLKVPARKRQVIERVQPARNAASSIEVDALVARRKALHWSRRAVEVLRNEGLSDADLADIALCSPNDVRAWLSGATVSDKTPMDPSANHREGGQQAKDRGQRAIDEYIASPSGADLTWLQKVQLKMLRADPERPIEPHEVAAAAAAADRIRRQERDQQVDELVHSYVQSELGADASAEVLAELEAFLVCVPFIRAKVPTCTLDQVHALRVWVEHDLLPMYQARIAAARAAP